MKKILMMSVITATMLMAGGDIAPTVDAPIEVETVRDGGFYFGLAYGYMNEDYTRTPNIVDPRSFSESYGAAMAQVGYKYNSYIALEGRYWWSVSDITVTNGFTNYDLSGSNAFGIYVKPMYPVSDAFDIYALLGYGGIDQESDELINADGFSWGLGASYSVTESIDLFIDYVSLCDDSRDFRKFGYAISKDILVDSVNFGITYNF